MELQFIPLSTSFIWDSQQSSPTMANKKNFKGTKKFEKTHLKGVLERRKSTAKVKQRVLAQSKSKAKRAQDDGFYKGPGKENGAGPKANGQKPGAKAGEMSVDDFFKGGFEILEGAAETKSAAKLGKRKRDQPEAENGSLSDDDDVELSEDEQGMPDGSDLDIDEDGDEEEEEEDDGDMSKGTMAALAQKDPEFYKYLRENDPEALDFDLDADLAEVDELSGSEGEEEEEEGQPKKKRRKDDEDEVLGDNELTQAMVAKWKDALVKTHSLRAARQVVIAFRSAAHLNEGEESNLRYSISSPEAFHDIVVVALKQIPLALAHHLPVKESSSGKVYVQNETKKFKTLSILMKSYTASIIHLLSTLSDDGTLKLTLSSLNPLLPYLLSFRKLLKSLVKTVVAYWSQPASSQTTKITAFLVLRRLMTIGDKGIRESVLKAVYLGLVQGCRTTNHNTIQGINLMKNSAAELWGIDQSIGYTTAFGFLRQLAIHLRNSIAHNQNDSFKKVYNWQYVHSLDFWSCVLSEHCSPLKEAEAGKESQLKLLIYPLVQVTLGAMRLIPTAVYFPLRFQLVRSLLRISRATSTYIPLAAPLLEVLNSAEMKKGPKSSTIKPLNFDVNYKAPKGYLRTRPYQDGVGEQLVELFSEYFALWSTNIAFPEFSLPVVIMIKRWVKDARKKHSGNPNNKLVGNLVLLAQKLEANAKFIEGKRSKVDFAPQNRSQVDAFLRDFEWEKTPIGAFVMTQRKLREERQRMMEESRKEEDRKRKESKLEAEEDEEDEEDDEEVDLEGSENEDEGFQEEEEEEEEEDEEEEGDDSE